MPVEFENDEEKKATKLVQSLQIQVQEIRSILTMMDRQTRAPKTPVKVGEIAQEIYRYGCLPQQQDILSQLPAELQREIWSYLVVPADRLMLALSCKSHATVFEEMKRKTQKSIAPKRPAKAMPMSKSGRNSIKAPSKLDKLYTLHRLCQWMPNGYRLCYECVRFRSKTRQKIKMGLVVGTKDSWGGRLVEVNDTHDEKVLMRAFKEAIKTGWRCPDCCVRAQLDIISAKKAHKELKKELARLL